MILRFGTDMPGQTMQTQIRLLLEEQSDQGLHCLPFRLHRLDLLLYCRVINPRGAVWLGSTLFAIPSASFGFITLL